MDARTAESPVISERESWLQRERASGRFYDRLGWIIAAFLAGMMAFSVGVLRRGAEPGTLLSPPLIALLLIANLLPTIALMVLYSRRVAMRRAEQGGLGSGRLHVRLVALFSALAAVPTVLVAIFASLLFQSGLEFWFSNRARTMLENTVQIARASYDAENERVASETVTMSGDLAQYLRLVPRDDPRFVEGFGRQVLNRNLSEAIIANVGPDGVPRSLALVNPYDRPLDRIITPAKIRELGDKPSVPVNSSDRVGALTRLDYGPNTYLYAARVFDPRFRGQIVRANGVLHDYQVLLARSRSTLAAAFNRMTGRLEEQTNALRTANTQLDTRRAFIEAVLSSVTAGVVAVDSGLKILLLNRSAENFLQKEQAEVEGQSLSSISPELDEFMRGEQSEANVLIPGDPGQRTLAVKRLRYGDGSVLTFDDITDQLSDQRRAAWSDIARRIAHEIKNPLTPIQLAAERLERRFGKEITTDKETFERLTATIVRQVGDLRRMVDEFSNFARMPKPVFREENIHDIARQSLFLHEVAHPAVSFALEPPAGEFKMVGDRRQLAQALTNVVKNAVEAIEARRNRGEHSLAGDRVELKLHEEESNLVIDVLDTGIGLPEDRERLTQPYMTTRVRGTGLGLAIVKKIVEEHMGEIAFLDRPGGGTHVRISFDTAKLAALAADPDAQSTDNHEEDEEA